MTLISDKITQERTVSEAFSRQSPIFDDVYENNGITLWMRNRVRHEVLQTIKPGSRMLELNCGTGIDSVFFAKQGFDVLATDNAPGMLQKLDNKIQTLNLQDKLSARRISFNNLEELAGDRFDYVFSNFGGLNCTDNLEKVLNDVDALLNKGGYFSFAIMPTICPWELLMMFKGYFKTAFRRFKSGGTPAHLEGVHFDCYYHNPGKVMRTLGNRYELVSLKGLAIAVPPPFIEYFIEHHPKLFKTLEKIDNALWDKYPFNHTCDHYLITMQKK
ncbi:MAG: class I SAM-dependent methyltransferase [Sphingobacteriales bacterium]|nr:MAG: class I SAM-dependent methyltransferase [Sphingobacteriales bacterium]